MPPTSINNRRERDRRVIRPRPTTGLVGESHAFQAVVKRARQVAQSDLSVCITGETGTGKELIAKLIHDESHREGEFVCIDCSVSRGELFASSLLGHVAGAYTDAQADRPGLIATANKGTLLLDEIGRMDLAEQRQLLRVTESRCILPLGSDRKQPVDVRFLCASSVDLVEAVAKGEFIRDLFYRLAGEVITMPPLRDRQNDLILLARHFSEKYGTPPDNRVWGPLRRFVWPGNVRELKQFVDRLGAITNLSQISEQNVGEELRRHKSLALRPSKESGLETNRSSDSSRYYNLLPGLGPLEDGTADTVLQMAVHLGSSTPDYRRKFVTPKCRLAGTGLESIVASAIVLYCTAAAETQAISALEIAVREFGMRRLKQKSRADLSGLMKAVRERLDRLR